MNSTTHGKITIAVDALAISRRSAGSFTVLLGLMIEVARLCDYRFMFYVVTKDIEEALGQHGGRFEYVYTPRWAKKFVSRFFWEQFFLPRLAKKAGCALIYSASGYPEVFGSLPVVSHQQNLWSFAKPQPWWAFKNRVKSLLRRKVAKIALRRAKANVFISDFLRDCANEMVPDTAPKNFTVHNAISPINISSGLPLEEDWAKGDFCLAVGSLAIHKNYPTLVRAFRLVADEYPDLRLVIVGNSANEYSERVKQLCKEMGLAERIIFTGRLEFEKIISLYCRAKFSINVSLLEGFGLPVLESIALGCAAVCSDTAAFREIGGEAVVYCDPTRPEDIAEKMLAIYRDDKRRKELNALGHKRTKCFSWQKSANKLLEVFRFVLEG